MHNSRVKPLKWASTTLSAASLLAVVACGNDATDSSPSVGGSTAKGGSTAIAGSTAKGGTTSVAGSGGTTSAAGSGTTAGSGGTTSAAGSGTTAGSGGITSAAGSGTTAGSGGMATAGSGGMATAGSGGTTSTAGSGTTAGSGGITSTAGSGGAGTAGSTADPGPIPKPDGKLYGWASTSECGIDGVSGGGDQEIVDVPGEQLQDALDGDMPRIVRFAGDAGPINLTGTNKTIMGIDGAHIRGGLRISGGKKNVIIRNMKFSGGEDAIEVSGASCIWFDHIDAFDGQDGNMDIVRGSDLITVSWSRFYYVEKNHDHRLSNLNGNNPSDTPGKINVTFHHNWWGDKVLQRMPRVRHGKVHVFNNYYSTKEAQYFVGLSDHANLLVQNNFAEHAPSEHPVAFFNMTGVKIKLEGNKFAGVDGKDRETNPGDVFTPPYPYTLHTAEQARAAVMMYAGAERGN